VADVVRITVCDVPPSPVCKVCSGGVGRLLVDGATHACQGGPGCGFLSGETGCMVSRSMVVAVTVLASAGVGLAFATPSYGSRDALTGASTSGVQASSWLREQDGYSHACGIKSDSTLWCWLSGEPGKVGSDTDWAEVGVGGGHNCAVRVDHSLWCWGHSTKGALGLGGVHRRLNPTQVGRKRNWLSVAAGGGVSCGIRLSGSLWCWGNNQYYELGLDDTVNRWRPTLVAGGTKWSEISVSGLISCGVRRDGSGWCWGYARGQVPTRVDDRSDWSVIAVGSASCGIRTDQTLWCWGINPFGQLGDGTTESHLSPEQIGDLTWRSVALGEWDTCGIQASGTLWCWGLGGNGQLGLGHEHDEVHVPTQVGDATNWSTVSLSAMDSHAVDESGLLYGWGSCEGDLGLDRGADALVPTLIPG
jgi:alpha-tubulin suppressor-like RCC1 family protein